LPFDIIQKRNVSGDPSVRLILEEYGFLFESHLSDVEEGYMEKDHHDLLDRAFERGKQYEMRNGGCPQCTLAAVFDVLGLENDSVFKAATAFADGVGLTGDGHCGALSGGTIAIGYLHGRDRKDFGDMMGLVKANLMAKQLRDRFVDKYGTVRCRDLQKRLFGRFYNLYDPEELQAAFAAGMLDTCSNVVGDVARMTVDILLANREDVS